MPWSCKRCQTAVEHDNLVACPACGAGKTDWTMVANKTREFRVVVAPLRAERGPDEATYPPDDPRQAAPHTTTPVAPAMPRACVRRWLAQGHLPPTRHSLWVRVPGKEPKAAPLQVTVDHAAAEAVEVELEAPAAADGQGAEARLLLVFGPGEPIPEDALPGVRIVDVGEADGRRDPAPQVSLRTGKKKPVALPVEVGLCDACGWIAARLLDASGTAPLPRRPVVLEADGLGRLELESDDEGRVLLPGVPFLDHELVVGEDAVPVPAIPTPEPLHRRHVPSVRLGFPRLQLRDRDDFPLLETPFELVAEDGSTRSYTTDADGFVRLDDGLLAGVHTVRVAREGGERDEGAVEPPVTPREAVVARLGAVPPSKVHGQRGLDEATWPADDERQQQVARRRTPVAPALPRACVRRWLAEGHLPPTRHSLWARVADAPGAPLSLRVEHEAGPAEVALPAAPGADGAGAEARVLLVFGPGEPIAADALPGVTIVDVGERAPAPTVTLTSPGEKPATLPVEPGVCDACGWVAVRLLDASGTAPLAKRKVALEVDGLGRVELESDDDGRVLLAGVPFADHELEVGEDRVPVPAVPTQATPHLRHVPHAKVAFAKLQVRDPDGFPLDGREVELVLPDGTSRTFTTDADGLLQADDTPLPAGAHRVRSGGAEATVELPTTPRERVVARLARG